MTKDSILKTADLATICHVDLKTLHNWIDKGQGPKHYRTPGRHLRFLPPDVAVWLSQRGMPVPGELKRFLTTDEKLAADVEELGTLLGKMSFSERGDVLEKARGVVAARTGAAA